MKKHERAPISALGQFLYPLGIRLCEGENYRQREAYEVAYLKDDEIPRYQFVIAASARRAGSVFRRLFRLLGERVLPIVAGPAPPEAERGEDEPPPQEDGGEPWRGGGAAGGGGDNGGPPEDKDCPGMPCDVWVGQELDAHAVLRAFSDHEHLLLHDGWIGFGAHSAEGHTELFLSHHKLIYFCTKDLEAPEHILQEAGLFATDRLRHFSDLSHVHSSLSELALGEDGEEVFEEFLRFLRLELQDTREYT